MRHLDANKWSAIEKKGKPSFILKYGILKWGILTGIFFCVIVTLLEHGFKLEPFIENISNANFLVYLIITMLCGTLFGTWMWNTNCKKYSQTL